MSDDLKQILEFILVLFLVLFLVTNFAAFVQGACEATSPTKGCEYRSIVAYHPARILACELFKQRW